jgi:hypothetical protein
MAQSIYLTLETLETETSVPAIGEMVTHKLPAEQLPTAEQYADKDQLLAWAEENDFTHACLQKGINQHIIDIRAKFKLVKKGDEWTPEYGDNNVKAFTWKVKARPENAKSDEEKAKEAMAKLSPEQIAEIIAAMQK